MNLNKKLFFKNITRKIEDAVYLPGYGHVIMAVVKFVSFDRKRKKNLWEKKKMLDSPFPRMFLNAVFYKIFKSRDCVVKG